MADPLLPETPSTTTFGGPYTDYDAVVDPETEFSATNLNKLAATAAALANVSPRAWCVVTNASGWSILSHGAVWGSSDAVKPTVARNSTGNYTITWQTSYTDLRASGAESHGFAIRGATVTPNVSGLDANPTASFSGAVLTVESFTGGVAADMNLFTVVVY